MLHSREKEGAPILHDSMDGTGEHCAKWNKPGGEGQIPYDHLVVSWWNTDSDSIGQGWNIKIWIFSKFADDSNVASMLTKHLTIKNVCG